MTDGIVRRALISVTNKDRIVDFARGLVELGVEIISTGGTQRLLAESGINVVDAASVTGMPEMLDGRVKTLHPNIHGGILARRDKAEHMEQLQRGGITPIDLVVVNLYAFEDWASRSGVSFDEVVEHIDIGGPALLRAAAKNHSSVTVLVDPNDYHRVLEILRRGGDIDANMRRLLALKVFEHTAKYDQAIATWLSAQASDEPMPRTLWTGCERIEILRYGENPHQKAAIYADRTRPTASLVGARQIQGKELSFNNLLDADAALGLVLDLGRGASVFVKHNNPSGAARQANLVDAIRASRDADPVSAFGGVVALSSQVDAECARLLAETFLEVIISPRFTDDALKVLEAKKNLRLLALGELGTSMDRGGELRRVRGGWLYQTPDVHPDVGSEVSNGRVVSKRGPSEDEMKALRFAWTVAKHVRSNAIVFATDERTVAIGAGQMSRVDSVALCRMKGKEKLKGCVVASDAFFPFRDGVDLLAEAGATAIVQPGGSVRDSEIIDAANEHKLAMVFTGVRHFRH